MATSREKRTETGLRWSITLMILLAVGTHNPVAADTPVLSTLELRGGARGLVLVLGADSPFRLETVTPRTKGKGNPTVVLNLSGIIYGLNEFAYESFPSGCPVVKVEAVESPEALTARITLRLSSPVDSVEAKRKGNQWLLLLSRRPISEFAWSAPGGGARRAPVAAADTATAAAPGSPPENATAAKKSGTSSPGARLTDIRLVRRERVEEMTFEFDSLVTVTTKRDGNMIMMAIPDAQTVLKPVRLPAGSGFAAVQCSAVDRVGVRWLKISVTIRKEETGSVVITRNERRINLSVMRSGVPGFSLWSAKGGQAVAYAFADRNSRGDISGIERKAQEAAKEEIAAHETFSLHSATPPKENATSSTGPSSPARIPAPAAAAGSSADTAAATPAAPVPKPQPLPAKQQLVRMAVVKDKVNLRREPSARSKILRTLPRGSTGWGAVSEGEWVQLRLEADTGWISTLMVKDSSQLPDSFWKAATAVPRGSEEVSRALVEALPEAQRRQAEAQALPVAPRPDTTAAQSAAAAMPAPDPVLPVQYRVNGRDPFVPLRPDQIAELILPDVEKAALVGTLFDPAEKLALLEDLVNAGRSYTVRVGDAVRNGRLLKVEPEKAVFLLTEFGISRTVTLKLSKKKPPALSPAVPNLTGNSRTPGKPDSPPPREEEGL